MRLTDAGDTDALAAMFRDDSSGSGGGAEGGEYGEDELVLSADDLGVPDGGSVTLSIEGGDADYEETVEADADGMLCFHVPRQRVGSEITVSLIVKKANGRILCSGKKTMRVSAGCQFSVTLKHSAPEDFVFVAGNGTVGDLYVCIHEVTQSEYEKYCSYGADSPSDAYGVGPDYPAYYVSWYDALIYCNLRSMAEGLTPCYKINGSTNPADWGTRPSDALAVSEDPSGWRFVESNSNANGYRLPTEAEWVLAADDGHTYSGSDTLGDVAWYSGNSGDGGGRTNGKSHPVKTKAPNAKGIYDMSGNVSEYCWDRHGGVAYGGHDRVSHGGSWDRHSSLVSVSSRESSYATVRPKGSGFRVVCNAN